MNATATRILGVITLLLVGTTAVLGLWVSPPDAVQGELVRMMYVHVPTAWVAYLGFGLTALCSALWLIPATRREWLDVLAGAAGEVGTVFIGLTLVTGSLWGRPTWGTYWEWDPRLTSTALLFLMFCGYLAIRRTSSASPDVRARRSAWVALLAAANIPIVNKSVEWWRSLHQQASIGRDLQIHGLMLQTLFLGVVAFTVCFAWLVVHRYTAGVLERRWEAEGLEQALDERRAEMATPVLGTA